MMCSGLLLADTIMIGMEMVLKRLRISWHTCEGGRAQGLAGGGGGATMMGWCCGGFKV